MSFGIIASDNYAPLRSAIHFLETFQKVFFWDGVQKPRHVVMLSRPLGGTPHSLRNTDVDEILTKVTLMSFGIIASHNYAPLRSAIHVLETFQKSSFGMEFESLVTL
ncbi:hypothetical protein TNCV_2739821 [Trichonephila clavipes]|nr:hypothetical protein TNCV_2739821 [Trichonephila clavipes]